MPKWCTIELASGADDFIWFSYAEKRENREVQGGNAAGV